MDVLVEQSSIAGITGISINAGFINDLPVGLNLMANMFEEEKVLGAAHAFQNVTEYHKITDSINLRLKG